MVEGRMSDSRDASTAIAPIVFETDGPQGFSSLNEELPTATLIEGSPIGADHPYFERSSARLKAGIWRSSPYTEKYDSYPCDEFMFVLKGYVFVENESFSRKFEEGNAFLIPRGFQGYWRQPVEMVKYYVIVG